MCKLYCVCFRHVCHKWHYKIAKALVVCLESKDYVQIRNALTVLFKILPHFPVIQNLASVIEKRIEKVCEQEKDQRKDLYIIATSYKGQLKAKKPGLMKENDFHLVKAKPGTATVTNGTNSTNTSTSETNPVKKIIQKDFIVNYKVGLFAYCILCGSVFFA